MFYPASVLNEIMPDILVQAAYEGLGKKTKECVTYITKTSSKLGRMVKETTKVSEICRTETPQVQHSQEGTRGVLPQNVLQHPVVDYTYRYGTITLCGLDNDLERQTVNNGSWRP